MTTIIDRRFDDSGKNTTNKEKFHRKVKKAMKEALNEGILSRKIEDVKKEQKVRIKQDSLDEPAFGFDMEANNWDTILPGNKNLNKGDLIDKPRKGGSGSRAGRGRKDDEFSFILSADEFISLLFEDCELPDLVKTTLDESEVYETKFMGYSNYGNPSNISIIRSFQNSLLRHISWMTALEEEIKLLEQEQKDAKKKRQSAKIAFILEKLIELTRLKSDIPHMDDMDLRYRHYERIKVPATTAVMFCVMDTSGSMDSDMKSLAKKFFILLHLFLKKNYERVQLVFVRHTDSAKEVSEENFFSDRESGGTMISSALELVNKIIDDRFNTTQYNIYIAQASDGDNWGDDNAVCEKLLKMELLKKIQYMCYITVTGTYARGASAYEKMIGQLSKNWKNVASGTVKTSTDIYPVFQKLFEKKTNA